MAENGEAARGLLARHRAETLAARLPPLLVAAERIAATVVQGGHGRRRVGAGETFWQFRRYQSGDAAASIDWRQSARSQPLFVRETEWEAAQTVWLWCDRSASMDYASPAAAASKRATAELLVLALAVLLVRGGERVGLLGSGVRPEAGRRPLSRLAGALSAPPSAGDTRRSLPAPEALSRDARLVLIGDLLAPLGEIEAAVSGFARRGVRGHLLQVLDPAEETLPFSGRVSFSGPEGEGTVLVPRVESVRDAYRRALAAQREGLAGLARAAGWSFGLHRTDHPPEAALAALHGALGDTAPHRRTLV